MAPSEPAPRSPGPPRDGPSEDAVDPRDTAARDEVLPMDEGAELAVEGITMPWAAAPMGTVLPPCPTMAPMDGTTADARDVGPRDEDPRDEGPREGGPSDKAPMCAAVGCCCGCGCGCGCCRGCGGCTTVAVDEGTLPPLIRCGRLGRADAMGKTGVTPAGVGAAYGCMVMVAPWMG